MEDCLFYIFSKLEYQELIQCRSVNILFNKIYYSKMLWVKLCERDYPYLTPYNYESYLLGFDLFL
jgi:hypothetical protein